MLRHVGRIRLMVAVPPSGVTDNPDGRGPLSNLGTHEQWNNPVTESTRIKLIASH